MNHHSPLLREKPAANYLGTSKGTLQRWRIEGSGPAWVKLGPRGVAYRKDDLDAWIASRVVKSTADARERGLTAA